jgi:hypothetical protein
LDEDAAGRTPGGVFGHTPESGTGVPLAFVARDAAGTITLPLQIVPGTSPIPELGFRIPDGGVYPLVVTLNAGEARDELARFTTYVIRLPEADGKTPPISCASVVPCQAPLAMGTDGRSRWVMPPVAASRRSPPPPGHPDGPRHRGPQSGDRRRPPPAARRPAPRISDADLAEAWKGRELLAGPFVPLDIDAWAASDLRGELAHQLDLGATTLAERIRPTQPVDRATWPATTGSTRWGQPARDLGTSQLVVPDRDVDEPDAKVFRPEQSQVVAHQPFDLDTGSGAPVRALTTDSRLRARYAETDNSVLNAQLVLADVSVDYFGAQRVLKPVTTKPRAVVVDVPVDAAGLATFSTLQAAFASTPDPAAGGGRAIVVPASLRDAFALPPATTARDDGPLVRTYRPQPAPSAATMGDYGERLAAAQVSVAGFTSMVGADGAARVAPLQRSMDVSGAAQLTPGQRQDYLDSVSGTVQSTVAGIQALNQEQITLAATEAELRVQIQNENDFPVAVRLSLSSDNKLDFPDGANFVTTLQPGLNRVPVKVQVRAGGTFPLFVRLASPDERIDLGSTRLEIRSTAVSGLGLVLSIGAGLFLLVWWIRNFRKSRRPDTLIARDDPAGPSADPPPDDAEHTERSSQPVG